MRLILASASPRRAALLTAAGFEFDVVCPDVDEQVRAGEDASSYVQRLAVEKSAQVFASGPRDGAGVVDRVVLGADTAVVLDGAILGKPRDDGEARDMLRRLSGRTHQVLTGISVRAKEGEWHSVETTRVTLTSIREDEIAWYVSTGEPRDKAGAYGIQGLGVLLTDGLEGSWSNVVGLPLEILPDLFARAGHDLWALLRP